MDDEHDATRARSGLIEDPLGMREYGRRILQRKHDEYLQIKDRPGLHWTPNPPKMPSNAMDEGLIYASRAGLISPQSVRPIERRVRAFSDWFRNRKPARGPEPDPEGAAEIFLALQVIDAIRRKRGDARRSPRAAEIREVLLLLFGRAPSEQAIKKRLQRRRRDVEQFLKRR
jgi:hypothetical protein